MCSKVSEERLCSENPRRTRYRLTEDEAKVRLLDPVRIDHDALTVEPAATTPGGHWRSGLVADDDAGAK